MEPHTIIHLEQPSTCLVIILSFASPVEFAYALSLDGKLHSDGSLDLVSTGLYWEMALAQEAGT